MNCDVVSINVMSLHKLFFKIYHKKIMFNAKQYLYRSRLLHE